MQQQEAAPDAVTYNVLISACEKGQWAALAPRVFWTIQQKAVLPSVFTYTALISACGKGE